MSDALNVGSFPYSPGFNPYQRLATEAIERAGAQVTRIAPVKWFPVQHAFATNECNILHFDWPHDWYHGKNAMTRMLKRWMYIQGLKKRSSKKLVWTAHNLVAHDAKDLNCEFQMLQRLVSRCDGIVVMSDASEEELRRLYEVPATTLVQKALHGHYIDCYENNISRSAARNKLGIDGNEQVFLSIGSVRPYKGHLDMIRAFGAIARQGQRLLIAGKCSVADYESQMRSEAVTQLTQNPNCHIDFHLKSVPDEQLQIYFNASDICVLPFARVLNSGSLLMAMSFGMPVVASKMGSIPEIVFPESSVLFAPESPNGLRVALDQAVSKFGLAHDALQPQRDQLIQRVKEAYDWLHFGNATVDLYRRLLRTDAKQA